MNLSIFDIQADFCKALGNATRLQILHALRRGPLIVAEIVRETGLGQSLVSRQLGILRNGDVVKCHRERSEMVYQLADESIGEVCDLVRKVLSARIRNQSKFF
jgi:DNA-binding transcriptional ArsR family regulator